MVEEVVCFDKVEKYTYKPHNVIDPGQPIPEKRKTMVIFHMGAAVNLLFIDTPLQAKTCRMCSLPGQDINKHHSLVR